jgi:hypothetical protein
MQRANDDYRDRAEDEMRARIGEAVYIAACVLALICTVGMIFANVFYVGGGLIPDLGAILVGGVIWLLGRVAKALLSVGTSHGKSN